MPVPCDMAFGSSLAVWEGWLFVGAPDDELCPDSSSGCTGRGSVWLYFFNYNTNMFELNSTLRSPNARNGDHFGASVAVWQWDMFPSRVFIGVPGESTCASGTPWIMRSRM